MRKRIRRSVSLPPSTSEWLDRTAAADGLPASRIVRIALELYRGERQRGDLLRLQDWWTRRAIERGVLTEYDLAQLISIVGAPTESAPFDWDD